MNAHNRINPSSFLGGRFLFTSSAFLAPQDTAKQAESLDTCCLRLIPCRY